MNEKRFETMEEFAEAVRAEFEKRIEKSVIVQKLNKNNGIVLYGLTVLEDEINISATIYLEPYYEVYEDTGMEYIVDRLERVYEENKPEQSFDISKILDYESIKENLRAKLINYELNREFLKEEKKKKEQEFQKQFREMIQSLSAALNTGYSVENAFYETQKELKILYPPEARISKELLVITRKLRMHIPVEQVLEEFAEQVLSEDVKSFVTVFVTAKKSGGDMIGIIRNTANQIGDKIEVKREIDTMLAAKKYEFQIMSVVPYGIIGYMSLSFPEFMNELYGNMAGIGVMTLCLGIYAGAYYLGIRILRIDV